ncbi:type VI secretion system-associated protein TagF [Paraburkholderia sp. MMS20-SJTN17]|uniref:Type VI secretion system-associated protein TagF n=1 Tax=Paraburkholderia translucens TaxID=2886945 RepID=A0ABS8KDU8_9BURK|nr:type VI secretion system-associated protein TagF [Paraburkholderia sp. MMS20-SJTN17]MCC8402941.1 type VI secretion system-associated protein TagF [Paraburkholderia sp. MMS20-SJTN17]
MASPGVAGCFGKLRGTGDFVTRRLPACFVEPWDAMLQAGLLASRAARGRAWLDAYLTAPLWRFALGGGVLGENGWAGVLMPSVDSAGRHFPLTVAAPVDALAWPLWRAQADAWFERCAALALATLDERARLADFDAGLLALSHAHDASGVSTPLQVGAWGMSVWWQAEATRTNVGLPDAAFVAGLFDSAADGAH